MIENRLELSESNIDKKFELALTKVGGRLKLITIIIRRLKELRHAGLKQKGSFHIIIESVLDEIIDDQLIWEGHQKHKK